MDKRKERNLEVKHAISQAFFKLMRKRESTEISVADIVREANVARVSYYRNFRSKDDIVAALVDEVLASYEEGVNKEVDFYCYEHVLRSFRYFHAYQEYIVDILRFHYTRILWERLNRFHERMDRGYSENSPERYRVYAYIGALLNTVLIWISSGSREKEEEMAELFCSLTGIAVERELLHR